MGFGHKSPAKKIEKILIGETLLITDGRCVFCYCYEWV